MPDDTRFPALRSAMAAPYSELSDEALAETIPFLLPGVSAEDAEGFFDGIAKAFGQVTKVIQQNPTIGRVLSNAATGALAGAPGGFIGALGGAGVGALTGLLGGSGAPAGAPRPTGAPAGAPRPTGAPLPAGGASGIAKQIAGVITRPETWQAITQMAVPGGKQTVSLGRGGIQVPASSFAQLLGFLGNRLAEDAEDVPGAAWPPPSTGIDPASPADRAGALLSLLALTQPVALPAEPDAAPPPGTTGAGAAAQGAAPAAGPAGAAAGTATAQQTAVTAGEPGTTDEPPPRRPRRRFRLARPADEATDEAADEAAADEAMAAADLEAAALQALARELAS